MTTNETSLAPAGIRDPCALLRRMTSALRRLEIQEAAKPAKAAA